MSNVNSLNDIYEKKGEDFVKKLFSLKTVISEKISGASFAFEFDSETNDFKFFKKSDGNPLTKLDRVLMKFYDEPIKYFKKLKETTDVFKDVPNSYRFVFDYFVDKQPNYISYDNLPKNSLVLTHIVEFSDNKKKIIANKKELDDWANTFSVNGPPIIFDGKLTDDAKDKIFQFLRMTKADAIKYFKTTSFTRFLISSLCPDQKKSVLNDDIDKPIDGIIFAFENESEKIFAKLVDPVFVEIISQNKEKTQSNILPVIFGDMIEFMETNRHVWEKYKFEKIDFYDRYLEVMSKLFLLLFKSNTSKYKNVDLNTPRYMNKLGFDVNTDILENVDLIKLFEQHPKTKDLFKVFIALFRKKKKESGQFMSPISVKYQNQIVDDLTNAISSDNAKNESSIPLFSEFYGTNIDLFESQNIDNLLIYVNETVNENLVVESTTPNSIISFWQSALPEKKVYEKNQELKPINIIIGKFQPISNKHIKCAESLLESNGNKTLLIQISSGAKNELFSSDVSESLIKLTVTSKKDLFAGYVVSSSKKLKNLFENVLDKFTVESITVSGKYHEYFKKQIEHSLFEGSFYSIESKKWDDFEIDNLKTSSSTIINSIKENDYKTFRKLCPKETWSMFEKLRDELKN